MVRKPTREKLKQELEESEEEDLKRRNAEVEKVERKCKEDVLLRRLKGFESILELSKTLVSAKPIDDISYLIFESAKHITESKFGFVGYIDSLTGYLVSPTLTRYIWESCQVKDKSIVFKKFRGLWGWVLENRKTLLTNEAEKDSRSSGIPPGHVPIHRFLSAPAIINDTLVGQVAVANSSRDYNEQDLEFIQHMADLYAIALERERPEDTYRAIFNATNDPIVIHDIDTGAFLDYNSKFSEMFGYTLADAKNLSLRDISANIPPYTEQDASPHINIIKEKGELIFEWMCKDKGGNIFWVETSLRKGILGGRERMIAVIRDITERKQAEEALRARKKELEIQSRNLEEANTALRVLLKRREEDKTELEGKIMSNVKQLLMPFVERLKGSRLDDYQRGYIDVLESNLSDIISPFSTKLSSKHVGLTPTQLQVADLVRSGRTTKEIPELMNLSHNTIETHRKRIRKKLGLNAGINLRSFLLSLQ